MFLLQPTALPFPSGPQVAHHNSHKEYRVGGRGRKTRVVQPAVDSPRQPPTHAYGTRAVHSVGLGPAVGVGGSCASLILFAGGGGIVVLTLLQSTFPSFLSTAVK